MNQINETHNAGVANFLSITSAKKSRKTLMKLYFSADYQQISPQDKEEVFFLYDLLENIE